MSDKRSNPERILEQFIKEERKRFPTTMSDSDFFEIFAAQQVLKDKDLSDKEIQVGIIGKGNDGGIDGLYFFINGKLIQEDITSYEPWVKDVDLDIFMIQAKTSSSFGEDAIHKFVNVTDDLFTLKNKLSEKRFKIRYHSQLIEIANRIRSAYLALVTKDVNLTFHYVYATQGEEVDVKVQDLTSKIDNKVGHLFPGSKVDFQFMGAEELVQIARRKSEIKREINYVSPVINSNKSSCVCLVKLKDFYSFLKDENTGKINRHIFEANVRDYQGEVAVNKQIRQTLAELNGEDFWWLNNGITILTSNITPKANVGLILESPEIVNGLQTSNEVFNYFASVTQEQLSSDDREILLRIIVPADDPTRNKIIKATNSQTKIPPFALKATDPVQWDIEQFLKPKGLYYDRRKNYYKNQGIPQASIVSINELAQAVLAIKLGRPNDARARPGSILDNEIEYKRVFSKDISLELYYALLQIMAKIETFLAQSTLGANEKTNFRYYLALYSVCLCNRRAKLNEESILAAPSLLTNEIFQEALVEVKQLYEDAGGDDNAAKGTFLRQEMEIKLLEKYLPQAAASARKKSANSAKNTKKKAVPKKSTFARKNASKKAVTKKRASKKADSKKGMIQTNIRTSRKTKSSKSSATRIGGGKKKKATQMRSKSKK